MGTQRDQHLEEAHKKLTMAESRGHCNNHWPHIYTYGGSGCHFSNKGGDWKTIAPCVITTDQRAALGIPIDTVY